MYVSRVREILEAICAFEERRQALVCLDHFTITTACGSQGSVGCEGLAAFADSLMVGWESLQAPSTSERAAQAPIHPLMNPRLFPI
jgi:hypothetical protein